MYQTEVKLAKAIPAGLIEELVKKSVYCSPLLKSIEVVPGGGAVRFGVDAAETAPEVQSKLVRFVESLQKGYRHFPRKTVFSNDFEPNYLPNAWEECVRHGWVFDSGFGQVALTGHAYDLFCYFEHVVQHMAWKHFDAADWRFPTLMPAEVLGRCNYFRSFPHAVNFVAHLTPDHDVLESFSRANQEGPLRFESLDSLDRPDHCLTPVVCYHCYRTLENQKLALGEMRRFTAIGSCFRFESSNTTTLERLWDFSLREIVFVGGREDVLAARQKTMDLVAEWFNRLHLRVHFETASDPFFTSDFSEKTYFQMVADLKYEMRLNVTPDRTIAAGSFNIHNDFFGKTFSISSGEGTAFSSCIGFGVERLVFAFICQHGMDIEKWPAEVRQFVANRRNGNS